VLPPNQSFSWASRTTSLRPSGQGSKISLRCWRASLMRFRTSAFRCSAALLNLPCLKCARAMRSLPSAVFGPVEHPPCSRHRPLRIAGHPHGVPRRVFAPQRGTLEISKREFPALASSVPFRSNIAAASEETRRFCSDVQSRIILFRLSGRSRTIQSADKSLPALINMNVLHGHSL
jgi:hypothetical protein